MQWLTVFCIAALLSVARLEAASPDQRYIELYNLVIEGDELRSSGQSATARNRYLEAQRGLQELQKSAPTWNKTIVDYRLKYLNDRLEAMPGGAPKAVQPAGQQDAPAVRATSPTVTTPAGREAQPSAADQRDQQIEQLNAAIAQLQSRVATLNAKLKEALAVQPAAVDPRELGRAEERIKALEKERDLLNVTLEQARTRKSVDPELEKAQEEIARLKAEMNDKRGSQRDVAKAREELAEENEKLKDRLAALEKRGSESRNSKAGDAQKLKEQLEERERALTAAQNDLKRLNRAEKERKDLEEKVADLRKDLAEKNRKAPPSEAATLKARIQALELKKEPYSEQELALMKAPAVSVAKKEPAELPAGAAPLVRAAQQAFAAKRFDEAEAKYEEALKLDNKNVYTLANLAAIQMEAERFDRAEKNLKRALELDKSDAYSHMLMGVMRFRQEKYEEAFDHLSQSAALDPTNAETHNYLGITLSQKGQRAPAEAALRKAIQLSPGNPGAHHNLAVIYASQKPGFPQLARFHYQKALSAGHAKNGDLEKMIADAEKK